jgi:protein phosphatase PTC1
MAMLESMPPNGVATTFTRSRNFYCLIVRSHFVVQYLLEAMHASPSYPIPDLLNQTFHAVDETLSRMAEESDGKIHSGCTAVTAFLRIEDEEGQQPFHRIDGSPSSDRSRDNSLDGDSTANEGSSPLMSSIESVRTKVSLKKKNHSPSPSRIRKALRTLGAGSPKLVSSSPTLAPSSSPLPLSPKAQAQGLNIVVPPSNQRRVLYCANAGDARGVLCRSGKAVRLTYDHKGSDKQEAKRITDAGGFVMSGRVNGVLAVTRSLGDSSMKEFVVGAPYTTETELCNEDEFLILACDGVSGTLTLIAQILTL